MKMLRRWRIILLPGWIASWLLLCAFQQPPHDEVPFPPTLEAQLRSFRQKDDLSGWLYCQLQYVARSPVTRASLLTHTGEKAWRAPHSDEEVQAWLDWLINEGYTLLLSGDIVRSTDSYTAAFQWARQHANLMDEHIVLENILKPLGNNYTRLGDDEQALFIHRKALAVANALGDANALAGTYSNLANTSSNMGDPAQSLSYCQKGLAIIQKPTALRGLLLSEQADALAQTDQLAAARKSIRESICILERVANTGQSIQRADPATQEAGTWLLTAYQQAGDIDAAQPGQALAWYNKALALQAALAKTQGLLHKRQEAKLFQRLGALYVRLQQPAQATQWLERCLSVLIPGKTLDALTANDCYAENTLMDLLFTAAGIAAANGETDKALRLYQLCFATEKVLRQEFVTGTSRERSVSDSHKRYEAAISTAWHAWQKTGGNDYRKAVLAFMESSKSQLLLDELLQQQRYEQHHQNTPSDSLEDRIRLLEKALIYYKKEVVQQQGRKDSIAAVDAKQEKQVEWDLAQLHKKVGSSPIMRPFAPDELAQFLHRDNQLIRSFFAGEQTLYIIEAGRDGIHFADELTMPKGWQDSLQSFTHTWFEQGAGNMINRPQDYYGQAYVLYQELFATHPLQAEKEYILLPDGTMNQLPIEALVTRPDAPLSPENWPYVIRQTSLSYAWSLRTLAAQQQPTGNKDGLAGFFISGDQRKSPALQAVDKERAGIAQAVPSGNWYINKAATAQVFRSALQSDAIVHISTHAFSGKDTLQTPFIELYNEPFYLFELKDLEKHPALVVLSACRTGDGRMVTGEGVQSLARAFTAGGANAVVASGWNVNDAAAARLMEGFYKQLQTGAIADHGATSLRQAKLDWLNDPHVPYLQKLPYYWAALQYSGSPNLPADIKNVSASKISSHYWTIAAWTMVALLTFLFIGIVVARRRR